VLLLRFLQNRFPRLEDRDRFSPVTLSRRDVLQRAVAVDLVVPVDEAVRPFSRRFQALESVGRVFGPVFERPEE